MASSTYRPPSAHGNCNEARDELVGTPLRLSTWVARVTRHSSPISCHTGCSAVMHEIPAQPLAHAGLGCAFPFYLDGTGSSTFFVPLT
jgi:hypothetical protein